MQKMEIFSIFTEDSSKKHITATVIEYMSIYESGEAAVNIAGVGWRATAGSVNEKELIARVTIARNT
jgi:hypothetical protein